MTSIEAVEKLEEMQSQIIHCSNIFGDIASVIRKLELNNSRLRQSISASHGLIAPLGNQAIPSVMAIREATQILRNVL